ncbi:DUF6577 family protein [Flagellimonas nanhaiensis]|uniref:DUF6577 family protein n=1 Tax=Flagellimonas nanhaiensis TaxID=2292706 RepID=UPI0011C0410F|nr:DUF6577 family protein [Allomuricauda nanhaiensis]
MIITETTLHIDALKKRFINVESISVKDIFQFYRSKDEFVKKSTVDWRIYKLVDNGIIQRIGRGKYKFGKQKEFTPLISKSTKSLYNKLKREFPYLEISIWSTEWLRDWMLHIPRNHEVIIETEKGTEESVFYYLSEIRKNVFLNPSIDILDMYANEDKDKIIIRNLITDAPLQRTNNVQIPSIEKIIVDLILDTELYSNYQGRDLESIIENVYNLYSIKEDRLLRYAKRRRKREYVESVIKDIV